MGGIEKADVSGTISYDPDNHDKMVRLRQAKIDGIAADIGPLEVDDPDGQAKVLVLGWGSTFASIGAAVRRVRLVGGAVAQAPLRHLSPFPANLGEVLLAYDKVLVPEINLGQLSRAPARAGRHGGADANCGGPPGRAGENAGGRKAGEQQAAGRRRAGGGRGRHGGGGRRNPPAGPPPSLGCPPQTRSSPPGTSSP